MHPSSCKYSVPVYSVPEWVENMMKLYNKLNSKFVLSLVIILINIPVKRPGLNLSIIPIGWFLIVWDKSFHDFLAKSNFFKMFLHTCSLCWHLVEHPWAAPTPLSVHKAVRMRTFCTHCYVTTGCWYLLRAECRQEQLKKNNKATTTTTVQTSEVHLKYT